MNGLDAVIDKGLRSAEHPAQAPDRDSCEAREENLTSRICAAAGRKSTARAWPVGTQLAGILSTKRRFLGAVCTFLAIGLAANAVGQSANVPPYEIARFPAPSAPAADTPAQVRRLLDSAQHCEMSCPDAALALYRTIAGDQTSPPLYRQTALFSLGRLTADRLRDTANAAKSFSSYCILYPDGMFVSEALLRLAELEMKRNPSGAVEYFCRFLAFNPDNPRKADAAYHLGLLLQQQNDYREAIRMYQLALEQLSDSADERGREIRQMIATALAAQQRPLTGNR